MPYGQSPYMDAAASISGVGQNMGNVALGVARLKYMQAVQQQREAIAIGRMAMQQQLDQSRMALYGRQADLAQAKLQSADELGTAYGRTMPFDMSQGPTREAAGQLSMAQLASAAARNAGLAGRGGDLLKIHNIPANAIGVSPMGGQLMGQGPLNLAPGHMYQMPGGEPVVNPVPTKPSTPSIGFAPQIGLYNRTTGDIVHPVTQRTGLTPGEGAHIAGSPYFPDLPQEVREEAMYSITNKPPPLEVPKQTNPAGNAPASGGTSAAPAKAGRRLDANTAADLLRKAGWDGQPGTATPEMKEKARQLAKEAGY